MNKQFIFSKDDFLMGVLTSMEDSIVKSAIVQNILKEKIKRLNSDIKFKEKDFQNKFGSFDLIKRDWETFTPKFRKDCNAAINKLNKLIKQKTSISKVYNELVESSFSNYDFKKLDKTLERLFKWEKPLHYDDIYKRG